MQPLRLFAMSILVATIITAVVAAGGQVQHRATIVNGTVVDPYELDNTWETAIRMVIHGNYTEDDTETSNTSGLERQSLSSSSSPSSLPSIPINKSLLQPVYLDVELAKLNITTPTPRVVKEEDEDDEEDEEDEEDLQLNSESITQTSTQTMPGVEKPAIKMSSEAKTSPPDIETDHDEEFSTPSPTLKPSASTSSSVAEEPDDDVATNPEDDDESEADESPSPTRDQLLTSLVANILDSNALRNLTQSTPASTVWRTLVETIQAQSSQMLRALSPTVMDMFYRATDLSAQCSSALLKMINAAQADEMWALEILTSSGQVPTGMLSGTVGSFGDYDQCLAATERAIDETSTPLRGKYCLLEAALPTLSINNNNNNNHTGGSLLIGVSHRLAILPPDMFSGELVERLAMLHTGFYSANLTIGVCVPSACSGEELTQLARLVIGTGIRLSIGHCQTLADRSKFDSAHLRQTWPNLDRFEKVSLVFVLGTIAAVVLATVFDAFFGRKHVRNMLVHSFSLLTNVGHLARAGRKAADYDKDEIAFESAARSQPRKLYFLEGLRVLTMLWVMSCHVVALGCIDIAPLLANLESEARPFSFALVNQIFFNGYGTVEIFFFISGFLLAYVHKSRRSRRVPDLVTFGLHRYLQLAIPMMALVACLFLWPLLLPDGPMFTKVATNLTDACRANWWKNAALVNNFENLKDLCLLHTWFLGADFQMHLLGYPLLLAASSAAARITLPTLGALFSIVALAVPAYLTWAYRIPPTLNPMNEARMSDFNANPALVYYPFYNHWLSYLVGFGLAIVLAGYVRRRAARAKDADDTLKSEMIKFGAPVPRGEQLLLVLLTVTWLAMTLGATFASYLWAGQPAQLDDAWLPFNAAYRALFPLLFVSGIAWIATLCVLYPNNCFDRFLSCSFFVRLGPLTGSMYLVHMPILWHLVLRSRAPLRVTYVDITTKLGGTIIYSLPAALFFQLVLVAPYVQLADQVKGRLVEALARLRAPKAVASVVDGVAAANKAKPKELATVL